MVDIGLKFTFNAFVWFCYHSNPGLIVLGNVCFLLFSERVCFECLSKDFVEFPHETI